MGQSRTENRSCTHIVFVFIVVLLQYYFCFCVDAVIFVTNTPHKVWNFLHRYTCFYFSKISWTYDFFFILVNSEMLFLCTVHCFHYTFHFRLSLLTGFSECTIKYPAVFLQFWCNLQTVAYTSDRSMSINPLSSWWNSSRQLLPIFHPSHPLSFPLPRLYFCSVSSYFCSPRCIDNFQQK